MSSISGSTHFGPIGMPIAANRKMLQSIEKGRLAENKARYEEESRRSSLAASLAASETPDQSRRNSSKSDASTSSKKKPLRNSLFSTAMTKGSALNAQMRFYN